MLILKPNGDMVDVVTSCDINPLCRDCPRFGDDCDGDVDHDPSLLEPCDTENTPWGKGANE